MRKFIIVLSLILFALSGFITFKALGIHSYNTPFHVVRKKPTPPESLSETVPVPDHREEAQRTGKADQSQSVIELRDTVARLKFELSKKDQMLQEHKVNEKDEKRAVVLAVLGGGTFRSGQVVIEEELIGKVKQLVPEIMESPDYLVMIEGHTDNTPINSSSETRYKDNMELSFLRAKAVADILMKNGISRERISVIGYGDTRPISSNETYEGRVRNRRVEIKLVPADGEF